MDQALALAAALGICIVGGFLPWVNTEAAVVAAALWLPPGALPFLVLGAATAQVVAKGVLYGLARWAPRGLPRRAQAGIQRVSALAAGRRSPTFTVLASSALGVPPFYLVALACGTLAVPFGAFLSAAFVGAAVRFAVVSLAAVLVRGA
jgi:membrane protein YqaA with SNARE-associated domain